MTGKRYRVLGLPNVVILGAVLVSGAWAASTSPETAVAGATPADLSSGDPVRGQKVYDARCAVCHSINKNRVGPRHRNTYGSPAGAVADYKYSKALANADIVWTAASLDVWLQNPTARVPGTKMGVRVSDAADRADVIAYLKQIVGSSP